jgi:hypothetical protein
MTMKHQRLTDLGACQEAQDWASKFRTEQAAWEACQRGNWMLWLLKRMSGPVNSESHRKFTACKCACARLGLHLYENKYPNDKRPRTAIESAEQYSAGQSYNADTAAAYAAAHAAANAAAYAAAEAAADTAAAAEAAAAYAAEAARVKMLATCADEIRKIVPNIEAFDKLGKEPK